MLMYKTFKSIFGLAGIRILNYLIGEMLMEKIYNWLGRRINDIVGDMQDIRDEGLHSLNELKVEYQANLKEKTLILVGRY